jgi:hypothetical protein
LRQALPHEAVLKLFAVRASVEMERDALERKRSGNAPFDEFSRRLTQ